MGRPKINRIGQKWNHLTVVSENFTKPVTAWNCVCDCGKEVVARGGDLVSGKHKSCIECGKKRQQKKIRKGNSYKVIGDVCEIDVSTATLSATLVIDKEDMPLVMGGDNRWVANRSKGITYVYRSHADGSGGRVKESVHRLILGLGTSRDDARVVDHIDGNPLNCRRENMRIVSQSENTRNSSIGRRNTSGVMGVCFHTRIGRWQVRIGHNDKEIHIGYFDSFSDAVSARKQAEIKYGYHDNHGRKKVEQ